MQVRDGMSTTVLTVGPEHTLRAAARLMADRRVGAARVRDHLTADVVFAAPSWSLEEAAVAMVRGGFRHLVVTEGAEIAGILSVRDIVRCWTDDGAICEVPESAGFGATAA